MKTLYLTCQKFDEDVYSINLSEGQKPIKYIDGTYDCSGGFEILCEVDAEIVDEFLEDLGFDLYKISKDFYECKHVLEFQVSTSEEKPESSSNPLMSLI